MRTGVVQSRAYRRRWQGRRLTGPGKEQGLLGAAADQKAWVLGAEVRSG